VDWSKLPDLVAVGLLATAFVAVARQNQTPVSARWLIGWLLIVFHFFALMFAPLPAPIHPLSIFLGTLALVWAGILFMRAAVPYRKDTSSVSMFLALLGSYAVYLAALTAGAPAWALNLTAILLGAAPLAVGLSSIKTSKHFLRRVVVGLQCALAVMLLVVQNRPNGSDLALNAILFTVYLSAAIHFWSMYRRPTAGAIITIVGFFIWANVFTVAPSLAAWYPQLHIEDEVWNLPKYVVAIGMILVLLEDQIAHNRHLALHDALTGLPNRRLFQDRLTSSLERARRTGTRTALLMLDIDHFKQINDTMGHHVGDLLLQEVARLFGGRVRRSDTVARTGGDEFAVVLEGPTTRAEAKFVGRSLLKLLEQPLDLEGHVMHVDASLGIALFPDDAEDPESLCIKADLRMYENKRGLDMELPHGATSEPARPKSDRPEGEPTRM
jgi:diguanylate cyclase (GGDEF)-like protein